MASPSNEQQRIGKIMADFSTSHEDRQAEKLQDVLAQAEEHSSPLAKGVQKLGNIFSVGGEDEHARRVKAKQKALEDPLRPQNLAKNLVKQQGRRGVHHVAMCGEVRVCE